MFEGFVSHDINVGRATIRARTGGAGEAVLLLHGYPQTHAMWHHVAVELAAERFVVAADLRGYGDSIAHENDFTFRAMAADFVAVMAHFGHQRFHVIGHDGGARTAHRMVLDHTESVASVALLDILSTLDVWRTMDAWLARRYYHWLFLSQPGPMPRQLISHDPVLYLHASLGGLSGPLELFHSKALAEYERAARDSRVVAAWCEDYTAAATIDVEHDRADLGRTIDLPTLILWGKKGVVDAHIDPLDAWRSWFPRARGAAVDAGHFLVEERPDEVLVQLVQHLDSP